MYKCNVKCCESLDAMEDVQRCVENCSESLYRAQGIIGQELQTYQASLRVLLLLSFFNPGRRSWDFKNCKKSVKLKRPLIRMINNQKLLCNKIELKHCTS